MPASKMPPSPQSILMSPGWPLTMWGNPGAEPRPRQVIEQRERGVELPALARGPFNQCIDVPNWFLVASLLRLCGTEHCLPTLMTLANQPGNSLNLRTSLALRVRDG